MGKVTTKQAMAILQERGIEVSYPTVAQWVREGKFEGATLDESNPRGPVWGIPRRSVERFVPPQPGRPRKEPAPPPAEKARKRARK